MKNNIIKNLNVDQLRMYNKYKNGDMKKIVLFCAGGMSTSLLVNKMREAAAKQGKEYDINAYGYGSEEKHAPDADCILLGPQIRFNLK